MKSFLGLIVVILISSPVWAQPRGERFTLDDGVTCDVFRPSHSETRAECSNGGAYGLRDNKDGTRDELKQERLLWIGPKVWREKRLPKVFPLERDPIPAVGAVTTIAQPSVALDDDATPVSIDVNCVWSQAAQNAQGGAANMVAYCATGVGIANESYANSAIPWLKQRLVGAKLVNYQEGSGVNPLSWMVTNADVSGYANQRGADRTILITVNNACGQGFLNGEFAQAERGCGIGNLTFVHELGHTQGAHHDPTAGGAPNCGAAGVAAYNCGHRSSGNLGDVMTYGAIRQRRFSDPDVLFSGTTEPSGIANARDNARAIRDRAVAVAARRETVITDEITLPPCTFTVSPLSLSFTGSSGSATVLVTTSPTCGWSSNGFGSWASVNGARLGSGTATVTVPANTGDSRSVTVRIATGQVQVSQAASGVSCLYTTTPSTLEVPQSGGSFTVSVSTTTLCGWSSASAVPWASVKGAWRGSGSAVITVPPNPDSSRTGTVRVATTYVVVTQAGQE